MFKTPLADEIFAMVTALKADTKKSKQFKFDSIVHVRNVYDAIEDIQNALETDINYSLIRLTETVPGVVDKVYSDMVDGIVITK